MHSLYAFEITARWPPAHPDRLQLYSAPTPNGVKVSIMLEEIGLPYEPHLVRFDQRDQFSAAFLALSPNNKIPLILDPAGPLDQPFPMFESGAILMYLGKKSGMLLPRDTPGRYEALQWLMFQVGGIGPMFGQLGFFDHFGGKNYDDKRPRDRFSQECRRLLSVLEQRLARREWILGSQFSVADVSVFPWVNALVATDGAGELLGIADFKHVGRALEAFLARAGVTRGLKIPART